MKYYPNLLMWGNIGMAVKKALELSDSSAFFT